MKKLFLIILLFLPLATQAYSLQTHAGLTAESARLFNQRAERSLTNDQIKLMMKGTIEEDHLPRPLNHYFDPVNQKGLVFAGEQWPTSKQWAQDVALQISALFNLPAAFGELVGLSNEDVLNKSNFTWQKAISDYKDGEIDRAFEGLGHILHLIEDLAVPAHTRNDIHFLYDKAGIIYGGADPYESYAKQFDIESMDVASKLSKWTEFSSLDEYFDNLSIYVNNNFYSKDSIGFNWYALPSPREKDNLVRGDFQYQQWDDNQGLYPLAQILSSDGVIKRTSPDLSVSSNFVLSAYWERLSKKAVQYSAGVIDLFFKEVKEPEVAEEDNEVFVAQVSQIFEEEEDIEPIVFNGGDENLTGSAGIVPEPKVSESGRVLIAEAFIDMVGSDNSEYIKIYNSEDFDINISNWSIQYLSGAATSTAKISKKNFTKESVIPAGGYYLIGLKDYSLEKDMGWSRSLGNTGASFVLAGNQEVITNSNDSDIIDALGYGEITGLFLGEGQAALIPEEGDLLKRLALVDGQCVSNKTGDLGYGCDTDNNFNDFESNGTPKDPADDQNASTTPETVDDPGIPRISYLKDFKFYEANEKYFVDLAWDNYPFITKNIPHPTSGEVDGWHIVIFYLNQEPEEILYLGEAPESHMWGLARSIPGSLRVKYNNCQAQLVSSSGLILPDTAEQCSPILDLIKTKSIDWSLLSSKALTLEVDKRDLNSPQKGSDYITLSYYAYHPNANFNSSQRLVGIDPNKYYLQ